LLQAAANAARYSSSTAVAISPAEYAGTTVYTNEFCDAAEDSFPPAGSGSDRIESSLPAAADFGEIFRIAREKTGVKSGLTRARDHLSLSGNRVRGLTDAMRGCAATTAEVNFFDRGFH